VNKKKALDKVVSIQEKRINHDEQMAFLQQAGRKSFMNFCEIVKEGYNAEWFHEFIGNILEKSLHQIARGEKVRIIMTIPPRHGKTELASVLFPAWALGTYPDMPFIISSYGAELSETNGLKTRDVINSDQYKFIFPDIKLRTDQKAKAKWMTNKGGSYTSVGIGTAVTGKGAKCILIDDPHKDRQEAESKVVRDTVWEYYRSTLYSRLEGFGGVIVVMQRWSQDDIVGRLMEEMARGKASGQPFDEWTVINFPAIADEDEYYEGKLLRKAGEPLWPSKFPIPVLENIRQTSGLYNWASQYQQDPILQEAQDFKINMFRYFNEEDLNGKYLRYYTLVDPAISQSSNADNTVVLTVAKEVNGPNIYRIKEDAGHFTPDQTVQLIMSHQSEYRSEVAIETVQYQQALKYSVIEEQRKRQVYFTVHELRSRTNKNERIKGLVALYEAGVIHHRHSDTEYERELLAWPRGRRDDRCIFGDVLIKTLRGDIPIKDVVVGDLVLTRKGYKRVLASAKTGHEKVITRFGLTATPNHLIHTERGWIDLSEVKDEDELIITNQSEEGEQSFLKIIAKDLIQQRCEDSEREEDVYDLKVEEANEYFANGILVHNCDAMAFFLLLGVNTFSGNVKIYKPKWLSYGKKK
jgi:hypothetical protein